MTKQSSETSIFHTGLKIKNMKNNIPYTLVDTAGQTTAVIDVFVPRSRQPIIAKPLMKSIKNIGQVCFIEKEKSTYRLQMMGNELSVNGTLAGGFYLMKKLKKEKVIFETSGLKTKLSVTNGANTASIIFPKSLVKSIKNNTVSLQGMKYLLISGLVSAKTTDKQRKILCQLSTNCPAAGIIYYEGDKIQPLIFVKETNTFVWETCCGSASIAYSLISNKKVIKQPSGKIVTVKITSREILYQTKATVLL